LYIKAAFESTLIVWKVDPKRLTDSSSVRKLYFFQRSHQTKKGKTMIAMIIAIDKTEAKTSLVESHLS
jgi:hypothetical protein